MACESHGSRLSIPLKFLQLISFSVLLDALGLLQLQWLSVVKSVSLSLRIDLVTRPRFALGVVVNLDVASLNFSSIHLFKSLLCTLMRLKLNVGEALRLLGLPVVRYSDGFYFSKLPKPIPNVIFFELIGQAFNKHRRTIVRHILNQIYRSKNLRKLITC